MQDSQMRGKQKNLKTSLQIAKLGLSLINSQARELTYVFVMGLKVEMGKVKNNQSYFVGAKDF